MPQHEALVTKPKRFVSSRSELRGLETRTKAKAKAKMLSSSRDLIHVLCASVRPWLSASIAGGPCLTVGTSGGPATGPSNPGVVLTSIQRIIDYAFHKVPVKSGELGFLVTLQSALVVI